MAYWHAAHRIRSFGRQSPLFGRMTGQWQLLPLPFGILKEFRPNWSPNTKSRSSVASCCVMRDA
jgi:hypothetical protein